MRREIRLIQFLMLAVAFAAAQTISGDLVVKVMDPTGAIVANGKLTLYRKPGPTEKKTTIMREKPS